MEELKHFSHEHPLILIEAKNNGDREVSCYGCKKAIAESEEAYGCGECSNVFLHKSCAQLPQKINYPMHSEHPLILLAKPSYKSGSCICNVCRKSSWSAFTYHCATCEFDVCVLCDFLGQIIEHPSHQHSLVFRHREASFGCDACGKDDKDLSYSCTSCQFWIHNSCALLPDTKIHRNHDHPLSLAYSLPIEHRMGSRFCVVCKEKVHPAWWVYYCGPCGYFVHLRCITKEIPQLEQIITSPQPSFEETPLPTISLDEWNPLGNMLEHGPFLGSEIPSGNLFWDSEIPSGSPFWDTFWQDPIQLPEIAANLEKAPEALPDQVLDLGRLILPLQNSDVALSENESESSNSVGADAMVQSTQSNEVSLTLRLGRGLDRRVVELPNESTSSYSVKITLSLEENQLLQRTYHGMLLKVTPIIWILMASFKS